METKTIGYQCPHCESTVGANEDLLDRTVLCPNPACERPFRLDVPRGALLSASALNGTTQVDYSLNDSVEASERSVAEARPTMFRNRPFVFLGLAVWVLGALAGAYWRFGAQDLAQGLVFLLVGFVGASVFFLWWLQVRFAVLKVTTKRSILQHGIIAKQSSEVRHKDVRNIQVNQKALERIFGVGDIAISSAGQDGLEIVAAGIPRPHDIVAVIREQQKR